MLDLNPLPAELPLRTRPSPFTPSVIARARAECNCVWANFSSAITRARAADRVPRLVLGAQWVEHSYSESRGSWVLIPPRAGVKKMVVLGVVELFTFAS